MYDMMMYITDMRSTKVKLSVRRIHVHRIVFVRVKFSDRTKRVENCPTTTTSSQVHPQDVDCAVIVAEVSIRLSISQLC